MNRKVASSFGIALLIVGMPLWLLVSFGLGVVFGLTFLVTGIEDISRIAIAYVVYGLTGKWEHPICLEVIDLPEGWTPRD